MLDHWGGRTDPTTEGHDMTTTTAIAYGIDRHSQSGELYATKSDPRAGDFISVIGPLHYSQAEALAANPSDLIALEWSEGEADAQWAQEQEWTATETQIKV
jgi:hypothetical protein